MNELEILLVCPLRSGGGSRRGTARRGRVALTRLEFRASRAV